MDSSPVKGEGPEIGKDKMTRQLFFQAMGKFAAGLLLTAALLFIPAGTFRYPNGWLLIAILFIPMFCAGIWMMLRAPDLLRKRLNVREEQSEQKQVVLISALIFLASFILAGLNYRFGWTVLPKWIVWAAAAVFLFSYLLYAEVLRENAYLSRTIEVQEGQRVVDTGLYGIVRHPMYMATVFLFLSVPLVLGSLPSFAVMLFYIPAIVKRIRNEEAVLEEGLEGYREYKTRVKYRIIPFIW